MPGPSSMKFRSFSQQGRQQEEQPKQGVTEATASVKFVEALPRQWETLKASRDAEYRPRIRVLKEQTDMQLQHAQPVFTSRQVREPAPRNPVPQMNTFDGSAPVSEWWTKFMAYIALHFINEATATNLLPFFLMGIVLQFFTHGLSKTPLTSIRDAFFSRFRPTVPISQTQQRRPQPVSRERDNFRRTNRSRGPGPCFRGGGQTKSQKKPAGLFIVTPTEKPSTTFRGKCEPKPVFRKFTEAASKLSTHSLYFKTKHFPRFQYVYNLVKDCKSRVEQCGLRSVGIDEMYKNVNIKIVIVGNFRDKDLHLLTKSTENKRMPKDKHIWKVQPLVCFDNEFFSESNVKKCDLELESTCHKILIQSDTFCDKRDKADDSIIIVERNKEQIKETITSCLEKPLFLLLHELLKDLKTEGSSRLASGLIAEIEAIKKQMKSCHIKDKYVSSIVLPSASASSIVPDNIIDFLFREPDVHSFGIWRNSSFKVFVKRTDEDKLRDELIKLNPNFFEMFNLEIEKRKLEDKQTDTMQGDVILAEIQDEGGGYRQGTLGGFVISTDKERKLYALTCNHLFPEEGKQAFTENLDEIGTCSFTTRENTCDFAAIEIKKEFSKNCDETFHKEDSGKTNAYVFSENLKDIGIVHKIGATTKVTKGTIISSEYYDKLKDNTSREHVFLVQGTQGNFSKEGDSGSLVFTRSKNARQTSVDVLGMVIGNKVTVLDDDEEQENQVEKKPGVTKGSEKYGNDSKNEKVDAKESSNTSSFQEGTFAASSSDVPDNISCCFRIDTALQLFKEKQGEEVKFRDDLSPSTSLSSDSDDTNRDTP